MYLTDEGLDNIEKEADRTKNFKLMFLIQIIREIRELKALLKVHQNASNCGNNSSSNTDDGKNKHV